MRLGEGVGGGVEDNPEYRIRREEVGRDVDLIVFRHQGIRGYNL